MRERRWDIQESHDIPKISPNYNVKTPQTNIDSEQHNKDNKLKGQKGNMN